MLVTSPSRAALNMAMLIQPTSTTQVYTMRTSGETLSKLAIDSFKGEIKKEGLHPS